METDCNRIMAEVRQRAESVRKWVDLVSERERERATQSRSTNKPKEETPTGNA